MATKEVIELGETYVELATGLCLFTVKHAKTIRIHVGSSVPDSDTEDYHKTHSSSYTGTETVYARAHDGSASVVVTEVV